MSLLRCTSRRLLSKHRWHHIRQASVLVDRRREDKFEPGQKIHGYTIQKVVPVPELFLSAITLTHDATKAQHLHISRNDPDNVFGVAFRTTPMDDTGVPHILEHTALCGSEKYPVRDPFFKMITRSLNTFMNAFTASDWTLYPFSSQNLQDYRNLMSVYLDASFFPRLREQDFKQEGWRLEHEIPQDSNSPIVFKGVVYNEMKGAFSTPQNLYGQRLQNYLMPSHTYSVVSGGEPKHIPDLSWQQLRDFHANHYHPSNSRFYTYGNFPLEEHLEYIDREALQQFSQIEADTSVPQEPRWSQPREQHMVCMPDPMAPDPAKQSTVSLTYLLSDITDAYEAFIQSLIGELLVSGEKAPFYEALLKSNIGSDYSTCTGYSGQTRDGYFSVGLQDIHKDDVQKVKFIIRDTIETVIRDGFEQERIDALLHKIELGQKHQSDKFGLYLGVNLLPSWIHDGDPIELLQVDRMVEKLNHHLTDNPHYLQDKMEEYFKNNQHCLTLTMEPDAQFEAQRLQEENDLLSHKVAALSEEARKQVYEQGIQLVEDQMKEQDISCLPTLRVSDIPPEGEKVQLHTDTLCGRSLQLSEQPTNGVTYFRALADLQHLPQELMPYVPLFCTVVTSMGAGDWDYKELSQQIDQHTGGLAASATISSHHTIADCLEQGMLFSSYCLDRNVNKMFEIWTRIFQSLDMSDSERLTTLIHMRAADLASSIAGAGHSYVMTHAASSLSPAGALREQMGGLTQVALMKAVAENPDLTRVRQYLDQIAKLALSSNNVRYSLNASPDHLSSAQQSTQDFMEQLVTSQDPVPQDFYNTVSQFCQRQSQTHFKLPFQVNYMSHCMKTVPYTHPDFASLRIMSVMLSTRYLHREIREKGGAYGGGAAGGIAGQLNFYSYRDPNAEKTLQAFDGAVEWVAANKFTDEDIEESKLAVFSQVDGPVSPGQKGAREFIHWLNYDVLQSHREQLFSVGREDLIRVALQYLSSESRTSSVSMIGPENKMTENNKSWTVVDHT